MFVADAAFALEILALVASVFLLINACKEGVPCKSFVKPVSYFVIAASIFAMLCTSYYSVSYWMRGYFSPMHRGGANCPMWQSDQNKAGEMMPGFDRGEHMMNRGQMQRHMMDDNSQ